MCGVTDVPAEEQGVRFSSKFVVARHELRSLTSAKRSDQFWQTRIRSLFDQQH